MMLGYKMRWVSNDLDRPWGVWTILSLIGCTISLSALGWRGNATFLVPGSGDLNLATPDFCAIGLLATSFAIGIFALTRQGESKVAPALVLVVAVVFGWFYLLFGPGWTVILLIGAMENLGQLAAHDSVQGVTFFIREIPAHPLIVIADCLAVIISIKRLRSKVLNWLLHASGLH
jgi:drug/metabolite transporter (DMT)-like permease